MHVFSPKNEFLVRHVFQGPKSTPPCTCIVESVLRLVIPIIKTLPKDITHSNITVTNSSLLLIRYFGTKKQGGGQGSNEGETACDHIATKNNSSWRARQPSERDATKAICWLRAVIKARVTCGLQYARVLGNFEIQHCYSYLFLDPDF